MILDALNDVACRERRGRGRARGVRERRVRDCEQSASGGKKGASGVAHGGEVYHLAKLGDRA